MILDARNGGDASRCQVYHAELMQFLELVVWVNDETAQYAQYKYDDLGVIAVVDYGTLVTRQAKKITIYLDRHLIVINPIADDNDQFVMTKKDILEPVSDSTKPICA